MSKGLVIAACISTTLLTIFIANCRYGVIANCLTANCWTSSLLKLKTLWKNVYSVVHLKQYFEVLLINHWICRVKVQQLYPFCELRLFHPYLQDHHRHFQQQTQKSGFHWWSSMLLVAKVLHSVPYKTQIIRLYILNTLIHINCVNGLQEAIKMASWQLEATLTAS